MDIIITEVTDMECDRICVAGWCEQEKRMVRPLSTEVHHHWNCAYANSSLFECGNVLRINPTGELNNRGFPHSREDTIINGIPEKVSSLQEEIIISRIRGSVYKNVSSIFNGMIISSYVPGGSDCPSLGAVDIPALSIHFYEKRRDGKPTQLRCSFFDNSICYDLSVSCRNFKQRYTSGGIATIAVPPQATRSHVRIGLAHPWAERENRCYAMVNNIIFY